MNAILKFIINIRFPRRTQYLESHVFDEEKSVRWNREEVVRQNQLIKDEVGYCAG